jgi:hypothetical protein
MKSKRCPRGTRRLNGECVKIEDYLLQQSMIPRKNCPKGTRKSKVTGECIKHEEFLVEQSQRLRKNCPPGTRRNSKGDCVPFTPVEKPVTLLGKNDLFQVSFNKSRLKKYEPAIIVPSLQGAQQSGSITLLNSIVSLGFIDNDKAKETAMKAKKHEIDPLQLLPDVFGIDDGKIHRSFAARYGYRGFKGLAEDVNEKLEDLQSNHATIIHLICDNNTDWPSIETWDHYIIAFKHKVNRKTVITYYDPQSKREMSSIEEFFPENKLLSVLLDELGKTYANPDLQTDPKLVARAKHKARQIQNKYVIEISDCMVFVVSSDENIVLKKINDVTVKSDSPRTGYFNKHFSEPVKMLGGTSLVQFSVTPEQFEEYTNFTYETGRNAGIVWYGGSCVLHSLFSLGLRNSTQVVRDAERMHDRKSLNQGIHAKKTARYLNKIAGLPKGSIIVVNVGDYTGSQRPSMRFITEDEHKETEQKMEWVARTYDTFHERNDQQLDILNDLTNQNFDRMIDSYLNKHLVNNHATIIGVSYYIISQKYKFMGHSIVAYKRNDKIEFFDPQSDKTNTGRSTVGICMSGYGDLLFQYMTVFNHSTPLKDDILIDDDRSCRIPFGSSPNVSPDSPLDLDWHADAR